MRGPRGAIILCRTADRLRPDDKKNLAQKIDSAVFPGLQGGPLEHIIAAKAVAFQEALAPDFVDYQKQVLKNAAALAETLMTEGLTLISGGTDNHLIMVDVGKAGRGGKEIQQALEEVEISVNMNMIPFDTRKPVDPSGIRLGTPALTTRGFVEDEMRQVGKIIADIIKNPGSEDIRANAHQVVTELTTAHPLYPEL